MPGISVLHRSEHHQSINDVELFGDIKLTLVSHFLLTTYSLYTNLSDNHFIAGVADTALVHLYPLFGEVSIQRGHHALQIVVAGGYIRPLKAITYILIIYIKGRGLRRVRIIRQESVCSRNTT